MSGILGVLAFCFLMVIAILAIIFLVVPLLKGIGWAIGGIFSAIGWVLRHVVEFVAGMLTDTVRFIGAIIAWVVLVPLLLLNIVIGRWSAAGHFGRSMKRECGVATTCLYRVVLQRPLRFLLLGGLLEGLEERVNEAVDAVPPADRPSRRTGAFEGYTIVGSLPVGGSGARLYVAEPDEKRRARNNSLPDLVVIKSFALTDGSTLPQIVRESRALEAAKQLGLVLEHGMDEHRFFYVMPYHQGDHLGIVTRQLHGKADGNGLNRHQLNLAMSYVADLLNTLKRYHEGGLWHKDVKPDNVIIHDGRAHLVDLGLVTPLRSAMTLTTHGTEYFRDPEMVRMALRGVKVHQVDGAKFDVYAAGAVLYFVVENTFPAHGGLSAFGKSSPEAVRWIIRRAMADYNKRYETCRDMLADLSYVRSASDPFAVKPAELPSMKGHGSQAPDASHGSETAPDDVAAEAPRVESVASAGSPVPPPAPQAAEEPKISGWAFAVGPGGVTGGRLGPKPQPEPGQPQRPRIRVTNWWTGAYQVDPDGSDDPGGQSFRGEARTFRRQARDFRQQAESLHRQVRGSRISARRAAREQIRSARARAREMRRRVSTHRHRAVNQRQPSGAMAFVTLAVLLLGAALATTMLRSKSSGANVRHLAEAPNVLATPGPGVFEHDQWPFILINDHPAAANAQVQAEVNRILDERRAQGWKIVMGDQDAEVAIRKCMPVGLEDPDAPMPPLLEHTLMQYDLGGILRIKAAPGDGPLQERVMVIPIRLPSVNVEVEKD